MKIAYFDCFCGAAGDMIVGACLDAGVAWEPFEQAIASLGLGAVCRHEKVNQKGITATAFHVDPPHDEHHHGHSHGHHRHLPDIQQIIQQAKLSESVKSTSLKIFQKLTEAEAKVHAIPVDQVHFHEVGAVDAIVDIVGAAVAMELLGVESVSCSALVVGGGTVHCDHGVLPVPAPATAELIRNVPIRPADIQMELLTPTGAAVLTTLSQAYGAIPEMQIEQIGYGAGSRQCDDRANVVRVLIGQSQPKASDHGDVWVLEANVDDCTGEIVGYVCDRLMEAGALDAFTTAIMMKKNRPGIQISVLCDDAHRSSLEAILFLESTTFGVRRYCCQRTVLDRTVQTLSTPYGPIRMKTGSYLGQDAGWSIEFEDCRKAAQQHGVPVKEVLKAAQASATLKKRRTNPL